MPENRSAKLIVQWIPTKQQQIKKQNKDESQKQNKAIKATQTNKVYKST